MTKFKGPFVRSAYNYDRDAVSRETAVLPDMDDMCQQSFKDECDINTIVRRFRVTGNLPTGVVAPTYGLFEDIFDFHSAMNAVAAARESFEAMPAEVRAKFQNDPGKFVEFCSNKENLAEMRKLGLALPEEISDNTPAPDVARKEKANEGVVTKGAAGSSEASEGSGEVAKG